MFKAEKIFFPIFSQRNFLCLFCVYFSLTFCGIGALAHPTPNVLMIGATLNDLNYEDRNRFSKYNVVERAFMAPDMVKELVAQCNPMAIVIKQPSGGLYEYSPRGQLIKKINGQSLHQTQKETETKFNLPNKFEPNGFPPSAESGEIPVQINGHMKIGNNSSFNPIYSGNSSFGGSMSPASQMPMQQSFPPSGQPFYSAQPIQMPSMPCGFAGGFNSPVFGRPSPVGMIGPFDGRTIGLQNRTGYFGNTNSFARPVFGGAIPGNPQVQNSFPNQFSPQGIMPAPMNSSNSRFSSSASGMESPQAQMNSLNQGMSNTNLMATNFSQPYPGVGLPEFMYPGTSMYSYMPGEGDYAPYAEISNARRILKQTAGMAANNTFPFWFDNYLTTDSSANTLVGNNLGGAASGTNAGFPSLQFNSNTTANAAVVGGQWLQTGLGVGSLLLDSYLDKRDINVRRNAALRDARGTPYYSYPDQAYSSYPAMPYQPLPSYAGY